VVPPPMRPFQTGSSMMQLIKWTSLVCVPLVFGCVAATALPSPAPACDIRASDTASGLMLESVVYGAPGTLGSYSFSLEKSGPAGTSSVSQGGDYEIGPEGDAVVSVTEVSRGAKDRYSAVMTVEDVAGLHRCTF
jgi:hypothetical protein